jgi:ABC-type branched-subunit amino acid transport system substrate-binding protein
MFRLPKSTPVQEAVNLVSAAITQAGSNRSSIREALASGKSLAGLHFDSTGELKQ